ncbi:DUF2249 domain-containing protein [Anoxybacillus sediminis]|nr:DUF2249 domain-containing protein [Brevibacillus sp. MCWH]NNV04026.1 DUF2249 domain-containing protein [Brevibacillus sp. MCWH]UFJ60976.1 DUF2249 domain-containing protein [Anoxybacillus sediminis]
MPMGDSPQIVELDVRPHLRKKLEPFQLIMETVKTLGPDDTFVLHTTFKPVPLLGLMKAKGFAYKTERLANDHWKVTFVPRARKGELEGSEPDDESRLGEAPSTASPEAPQTIELNNRGLEPPQPMIRTLKALEGCRTGDRVVIHNDRVPVFLIEELRALGYPYTVEEQPDGSARVTIQKT